MRAHPYAHALHLGMRGSSHSCWALQLAPAVPHAPYPFLLFFDLRRGAKVLITNRSRERAEQLAASLGGGAQVVDWEAVQRGEVKADVLANSTSIGMAPKVGVC